MPPKSKDEAADKKYEPDIPVMESHSGLPEAKLSPEVETELEVRRYIRNDGLFVKHLPRMFDESTGKRDQGGNMIMRPTMSDEQAYANVIAIMEASGREVVVDSATGRYRAIPGADLSVPVPGQLGREAHAVQSDPAENRQKINERALVGLQDENAALKKTLAELSAKVESLSAPPAKKATAKAESRKTQSKGEARTK